MKKFYLKSLFALFAIAACAFNVSAAELTVCEPNTATPPVSSNLPIYGFYADETGTTCQVIYPAEMLENMDGGEISAIKFYLNSNGIQFSKATIQFSLGETTQTEFGNLVQDLTPVASITFPSEPSGDTELLIQFDTPFEYEGGNLVFESKVTAAGGWGSTSFIGVSTSSNTGIARGNTYSFLPKATFTYEAGETPDPEEPTELTAAPTFNGYTEDGIHAYFVEIIPTEPSVIYYRIIYPDGTVSEWDVYEDILSFTGEGLYRVEAYAVADGKLPSYQIAYECYVSPIVGIDEVNAGKTVAGVRYFNMAGQEMQEANGMTIVVTTYTDGTTSAVKVMK